ncbi:LysR family transcriptional regulator [Rhodoplanes sp. Z2-YC6860]|nr:LysR family transcriptional regulator [Rhodoplanes sp. Z2-YC6860]
MPSIGLTRAAGIKGHRVQRRHEPNNIPIEVLRSFATVTETGSFTTAAAALSLTQSAISAQIKRLEFLSGGALFVKGTATLTEKGRFVVEYAHRILALNDQIISAGGKNGNQLRIGIPALYAGTLLRQIFNACRYGVEDIAYYSDTSPNLTKRFSSGHLDIVVAFALSVPEKATRWWEETLVWVCAADFKPTPGSPLPFLSFPGCVQDDLARRACQQAGTKYDIVFTATDHAAHFEAIRSGMGCRAFVERAVPPDVTIMRNSFLPELPRCYSAIFAKDGGDDGRVGDVVRSLGELLAPHVH